MDLEDLTPKYEELLDGFLLPDMEKCVERMVQATERKEKVLIYGDYDVDGVTASAILVEIFAMMGHTDVVVMLPDRFADGYGMSKKVIQRAKAEGVSLVMTVDCGSSNGDIIEELLVEGVETIVTDHHELIAGVPKAAVAVVNPKREDVAVDERLTGLCGAGVVFEVARALVARGKIVPGQEKWLMDLVVLGMIADSMEMRGENWRICYFGMKVLAKTRRVGLKKLFKMAKIERLDSGTVGFRIAPRLNASGRMASAELAFRLLVTKDELEAMRLAGRLEELNKERKMAQEQAIQRVEVGRSPVIVCQTEAHEGVIGIVAGRLVEEYKKPTFVFTKTEDEQLKCSGRSFGDFDLSKVLAEVEDLLVKGGGHAAACGATIRAKDFGEFARRVNEFYDGLKLQDQERFLRQRVDLWLKGVRGFNRELFDNIMRLEPFGEGNEEPVFGVREVEVREVRKLGKEQNHLSLRVGDGFKVMGFFAPEEWMRVRVGDCVDLKVKLNLNEWNGVESVEGQIVGLEKVW